MILTEQLLAHTQRLESRAEMFRPCFAFALVSLVSCRKNTHKTGVAHHPLVAAVELSATPRVPEPVSPVWDWNNRNPLPIPAPVATPMHVLAECSSDTLAIIARSGTSAWVIRRSLQPDATWDAPVFVGNDLVSVGKHFIDGDGVWLPWVTTTGVLRVARVTHSVEPIEDISPAHGAMFRDAHVLDAHDGKALVASTYKGVLASRILLHRIQRGQTVHAGAMLGDGLVAASISGPQTLLFARVRIANTQGGPWFLRAWRVDTARAMAIEPSPETGVFGEVPSGAVEQKGEVALGVGFFEFTSHFASGARAILFETVLGAERGALRMAWFPENAAPSVTTFPTAATSLGATLDLANQPNSAGILYWNDRNTLVLARATGNTLGEPIPINAPLPTEHTVYATARRTQWLRCGQATLRIEAFLNQESWNIRALAEPVVTTLSH
jgi:hypothetical protein